MVHERSAGESLALLCYTAYDTQPLEWKRDNMWITGFHLLSLRDWEDSMVLALENITLFG